MAIVSNTFLSYSAKGIREDLSNIITNIAPEETPYMSNIGRENVSNALFEYQTDTLAAAAANAQLEGDDVASFDAVTATVRMQNYCQISRKTRQAGAQNWPIKLRSEARNYVATKNS